MSFLKKAVEEEFYNPASTLGAVFYAVVFLAVAYLLGRLFKFAVTRAIQHDKRGLVDRMAAPFLAQLTRVAVYIVLLLIYVHLVPQLRSVGTALLAGVSVASIVIGLAAQNTLGNLIGGFALIVYRPFQVGDRLQIAAPTGVETGAVETLTLGYTVLVTGDNRRVVVPNAVMANAVTLNLSSVDPRTMVTVPLGISYSADIDTARAILMELGQAHPDVQEVASCLVTSLGDSSVQLALRVWCAHPGVSKKIECELYEQLKKRFDREGIEIPFPYRNVIIKERHAVA